MIVINISKKGITVDNHAGYVLALAKVYMTKDKNTDNEDAIDMVLKKYRVLKMYLHLFTRKAQKIFQYGASKTKKQGSSQHYSVENTKEHQQLAR